MPTIADHKETSASLKPYKWLMLGLLVASVAGAVVCVLAIKFEWFNIIIAVVIATVPLTIFIVAAMFACIAANNAQSEFEKRLQER